MSSQLYSEVVRLLAGARADYSKRKRMAETIADNCRGLLAEGFHNTGIDVQMVPWNLEATDLSELATFDAPEIVRFVLGKGWCFQIGLCLQKGSLRSGPDICFVVPFSLVDQPDSPHVLQCDLEHSAHPLTGELIDDTTSEAVMRLNDFVASLIEALTKVLKSHNPLLPHGEAFTQESTTKLLVVHLGAKPAPKCCCCCADAAKPAN